MRGPKRYVQWVNANLGFNPRAQANSDALSKYILEDLCFTSPKAIGKLVSTENLVFKKNADVTAKFAVRNVDLVLYEHAALPLISVQLSVENKTIMTAHGKARKNRYGDIIAYCNHVHNHRRDCIAGAAIVVNTSEKYENPDSFAKGLKRPRVPMERVVSDTIKIFEAIPLRDTIDDPTELPEALTVIVVNYDGVNPAKLVTGAASPNSASPINYDNFIKRLVAKFEDRFCQ